MSTIMKQLTANVSFNWKEELVYRGKYTPRHCVQIMKCLLSTGRYGDAKQVSELTGLELPQHELNRYHFEQFKKCFKTTDAHSAYVNVYGSSGGEQQDFENLAAQYLNKGQDDKALDLIHTIVFRFKD